MDSSNSAFWEDVAEDLHDPAYRAAWVENTAWIRETDELVRLIGDFFEGAISADSALAVARFAQLLRDTEAK